MLTLIISQSSVNKDELEEVRGELHHWWKEKPTWSSLIIGTKRGSSAAHILNWKNKSFFWGQLCFVFFSSKVLSINKVVSMPRLADIAFCIGGS